MAHFLIEEREYPAVAETPVCFDMLGNVVI
jgi:hypothetical protein